MDLYVYFDAKDKVSDVNIAATKVRWRSGACLRVALVPDARDAEQGTTEHGEAVDVVLGSTLPSQAFKCYGLDGAQFVMDWDKIHGPAVVVREKPPIVSSFSSSFGSSPSSFPTEQSTPFSPTITADEIVDTLLFFKDKNAAKIAQRRDAQRTGQSRHQSAAPFRLDLFPTTPSVIAFSHGCTL